MKRPSYLNWHSPVVPLVTARAYLFRAVVALAAVALLAGAVIGARAALAATGTHGPVAQALAPVAVDGSLTSDPGIVPENVAAPVSAPPPPQNALLPGSSAAGDPSTSQGPAPGTSPAIAPGTSPATAPGTSPATAPGTSPATAPGTSPATAPGTSSVIVPGTSPGPTPVARGSAVPAGLSPYSAWAASLAKVIDVPARALQAYGNAQNVVAREQPGCHLSWTTLAGIAHIESNHGRYAGRTLLSDGRSSTPIIGIPLDGGPSVQAISDTDGGALDGDKVWDRAVGPFQFIPSTWAKWKADANGDRVADPQNIDDAAVAAGHYLCAGGRNLSDGASWWRAILSYNNSNEYVQNVFNGADSYARAALR